MPKRGDVRNCCDARAQEGRWHCRLSIRKFNEGDCTKLLGCEMQEERGLFEVAGMRDAREGVGLYEVTGMQDARGGGCTMSVTSY